MAAHLLKNLVLNRNPLWWVPVLFWLLGWLWLAFEVWQAGKAEPAGLLLLLSVSLPLARTIGLGNEHAFFK